MRSINTFIFIALSCMYSYSQKISELKYNLIGDTIQITYKLKTITSSRISIYCSIDSTNYFEVTTNLKGDFGKRITNGDKKQIFWVLRENDSLYKGKIQSIKLTAELGKCPEEMIFVEKGTFFMGSKVKEDNARPVHEVTISSFCMDKFEIKQADFESIMGYNPSLIQCPNCPVDNVSYEDAKELADKVGKRLPTEAEWEFAARGGIKSRGYLFSGSNNLDSVGWYKDNSQGKTHPVGKKNPNEIGLFDMSGNVAEWCNDWFASDYFKHSEEIDPPGPPQGRFKIIRGGSWNHPKENSHPSNRTNVNFQIYRNETNGIRLAKEIE